MLIIWRACIYSEPTISEFIVCCEVVALGTASCNVVVKKNVPIEDWIDYLPNTFLSRIALSMKVVPPTITDPTGHPRPCTT